MTTAKKTAKKTPGRKKVQAPKLPPPTLKVYWDSDYWEDYTWGENCIRWKIVGPMVTIVTHTHRITYRGCRTVEYWPHGIPAPHVYRNERK